MSVETTSRRMHYVGNNSTATYSFTFRILSASDLKVVKNTAGVVTTLVKDVNYTVAGVGSYSGGTITLTAGILATGSTLTILGVRPLKQTSSFRNSKDFHAEVHEDAFDSGVMIAQQQQEQIDRSIKAPEAIDASPFDLTLPLSMFGASGANRVLLINPTGTGFEPSVGPTAAQIINAEGNAADAGTSATAAAVSAADALVSELAAAGSATSAASSQAGVAADALAAQNSAAAALTSQNSATTSATNASTSATNAGTSATNSANSATASNTSATNAAGSATAASGSATNSANSATAASTSATNAASSEAAAAASVANPQTNILTLLNQTADPAAPTGSDLKIYNIGGKTFKRSATLISELGSGGAGGGGVETFFTDRQAEDITKVTLFKSGTTAPLASTGGTVATLTKSIDSTSKISGVKSYKIVKATGIGQGEGVSFPTDTALDGNAKGGQPQIVQMTVRFENLTGAPPASVKVWNHRTGVANVIDQLIGLNGLGAYSNEIPVTANVTGKFAAQFNYISTDTASAPMIYIDSVDTGGFDMFVDVVSNGPSAVVKLPIQSVTESYTPVLNSMTGVSALIGKFRRSGEILYGSGSIIMSGTGAATTHTVSLPSGLTPDYNNTSGTVGLSINIGTWGWYDDLGGTTSRGGYVHLTSTGLMSFTRNDNSNSLLSSALEINDRFTWQVQVPIVEWANQSNVMSSVQVDVQTDSFRASKTTAQSFPDVTWTTLTGYNFESFDKLGSFDTTTGVWTAKRNGNVSFTGHVKFAANGAGLRYVRVLKNGAVIQTTTMAASTVEDLGPSVADSIDVVKGNTLVLQGFQSSGAALNSSINYGGSTFSVTYQPDFSAIASLAGPLEILTASSTTTPAASSGANGVGITLTPGVWEVYCRVQLSQSGTAGYTTTDFWRSFYSLAQTSFVEPSNANIVVMSGIAFEPMIAVAGIFQANAVPPMVFSVTNTTTIFCTTSASMTTPANARYIVHATAVRLNK